MSPTSQSSPGDETPEGALDILTGSKDPLPTKCKSSLKKAAAAAATTSTSPTTPPPKKRVSFTADVKPGSPGSPVVDKYESVRPIPQSKKQPQIPVDESDLALTTYLNSLTVRQVSSQAPSISAATAALALTPYQTRLPYTEEDCERYWNEQGQGAKLFETREQKARKARKAFETFREPILEGKEGDWEEICLEGENEY